MVTGDALGERRRSVFDLFCDSLTALCEKGSVIFLADGLPTFEDFAVLVGDTVQYLVLFRVVYGMSVGEGSVVVVDPDVTDLGFYRCVCRGVSAVERLEINLLAVTGGEHAGERDRADQQRRYKSNYFFHYSTYASG